jgi:hypothetical protein
LKISKKYGIPQYNKFNNLLLPSETINEKNINNDKISFHNKYFISLKNNDGDDDDEEEDESNSESKSENINEE